jgi:hypothetical protein
MAGPVIVEPRARDWKVMTACVAAAFGIGLASNDSYGFGLYLVGLPIAVMWAAALGHVFAKQAMAGAPTESVNSPRVPHPADSTIANAANGNADRRATAVRWAKRLFYWLTAVGAAGLCGGLLTDFARSELSWGSGPESAALGIAGGLFVFALFVRYARRRQRQSHSSTPPAPKTAA